MARARNLKPALFKNELLGVADPLLTLLFESLWCIADREGRLEDRPLRIKAETFPYRDGLNVNGYLTELERMGFICRYVVAGAAYIQVLNFHKHQNPHKTEKASELPAMPEQSESCALTEAPPLNNGSRPADSLVLNPDSLIPDSLSAGADDAGEQKPDSEPGHAAAAPLVLIPDRRAPQAAAAYPPEFEQAWQEYPERPGANKKEAHRAWSARVKAGASADELLAGARRYAAYVAAMQTEPQFIKQATTFFGPGDHYKLPWTAAPARLPQAGAPTDLDAIRAANTAEAMRMLGMGGDDGRTIDAR
ncbi:MAG TPA: hypothetical protein VIT92_10590 [Burkholderiaceae bacterium]